MSFSLDEFREYLGEMLRRANATQSVESIETMAGQMWQRFIPYGLSLYTLEGALRQICATFVEPSEEEDEE